MLTAASSGPNERQVVALQISRPPGDGPTGEHFVQDLGRHRGGPWHAQRGRPQGIGQVHALHPGLHQPRGHELIKPHWPEEARPNGLGGVVLIASMAWANVSRTLPRIDSGVCPSA